MKQMELDRDRFEFDKEKYFEQSGTKVSDYNDTLKATFKEAQEKANTSSFDSLDTSFDLLDTPIFDSLNTHIFSDSSASMIDLMSLTFICFTSVTIILSISLTFNYLTKMYGDKILNELPKPFHFIYKYYAKYLLFSNLFDLSMILLCQTTGLLLCLYLFFT